MSAGSAAWQSRNAAVRFVPITRFQRSSVCSSTGPPAAGAGADHERIQATEALEAGRRTALRGSDGSVLSAATARPPVADATSRERLRPPAAHAHVPVRRHAIRRATAAPIPVPPPMISTVGPDQSRRNCSTSDSGNDLSAML